MQSSGPRCRQGWSYRVKDLRTVAYVGLWSSLALVNAPCPASPRFEDSADSPRVLGQREVPAGHEFEFLYGHWTIRNRILKKRLADSQEWSEFAASDEFHALPGNLGIEETYRTEKWPHYCALGLLLYDRANHRWTLYWGDNLNSPGTMQTLASGRFQGKIGAFYGTERLNDKPVAVRILWEREDQNHAHWEQAYSHDGGASWETNWTMEFSRQKAPAPE